METNILKSVKMNLGIDVEYTAFDHTIITHINSAFGSLTQLGVGPPVFVIGNETGEEESKWENYIADDDVLLSLVKSYVYLKVRMLFDPPTISFLVTMMNQQIEEVAFRISVHRENLEWVDPTPEGVTTDG